MTSLVNKLRLFGISPDKSAIDLTSKIGKMPVLTLAHSFENDNEIIKSLIFDSDGEVRDLTNLKLSPNIDELVRTIHNKIIAELPEETPTTDNPDDLLDNGLIKSRYAQFGEELNSYNEHMHAFITETVRNYHLNKNKEKNNNSQDQ